MIASSIKTSLVRLGAWCALAGVTLLLTLLFSILGNLSCAVIGGMILGSGKRWQWTAVPFSLIFPGVLLSLSLYSKVGLPMAKVNSIALTSFCAFWAVLGLTFVFRRLERRAAGSANHEAGATTSTQVPLAVACDLDSFRGVWTCEAANAEGVVHSKTLRIEGGRFELVEHSLRGREKVVARGEVKWDQNGTGQLIFQQTDSPKAQS